MFLFSLHATEVLSFREYSWTFIVGLFCSWFLSESLKMSCPRSYGWFLIFLSNPEGLDCFLWSKFLPKLSKIPVTYPKVMKINRGQLGLAQCQKNDLILNWSNLAKWPVWISVSPVMKKLETSNLDSQETSFKGFCWVPAPLRRYWYHYNIFTWLRQIFLSLVTGATVIKFWQWNNLIEVHWVLLIHWG